MKLLILLIAMGVIGIIGVIGTVDESHAQTPLTLNPLPNTPEPFDIEIGIQINTVDYRDYWHTSPNAYPTVKIPNKLGHVFFPNPKQLLETSPFLPNATKEIQCVGDIENFNSITKDKKRNVPNLEIPDNINPKKAKKVIIVGIDWRQLNYTNNVNCEIDLEAHSEHPLILTKELIWTLYKQHDKKAYYFSPRANITQAQPIPLCTTETINATTLTLKNDTKMCYGKHGDNMVIVTKKLTGFYGAANSITAPTKPIALNSDVVETIETIEERERQKELERQKAIEKQKELERQRKLAEQQEKEYLEFLKKLYLPAI